MAGAPPRRREGILRRPVRWRLAATFLAGRGVEPADPQGRRIPDLGAGVGAPRMGARSHETATHRGGGDDGAAGRALDRGSEAPRRCDAFALPLGARRGRARGRHRQRGVHPRASLPPPPPGALLRLRRPVPLEEQVRPALRGSMVDLPEPARASPSRFRSGSRPAPRRTRFLPRRAAPELHAGRTTRRRKVTANCRKTLRHPFGKP